MFILFNFYRKGRDYGFDFNDNKNSKVGVLRSYIKREEINRKLSKK